MPPCHDGSKPSAEFWHTTRSGVSRANQRDAVPQEDVGIGTRNGAARDLPHRKRGLCHPLPHGVCVEPEDGKWPLDLFDGLLDEIETQVAQHPLQSVFYTDEPSMRDKPENIRRDSVRRAVQAALNAYDSTNGVRSFTGPPAPIGDHYVVPVLQLPEELFERFRPLQNPVMDDEITGHPSLVHAAVFETLTEAHEELVRPGSWTVFWKPLSFTRGDCSPSRRVVYAHSRVGHQRPAPRKPRSL